MMKDRCTDCGKTGAILIASDLGPLCLDCTTLRVHHPDNMSMTEADMEMKEFKDTGGKVS